MLVDTHDQFISLDMTSNTIDLSIHKALDMIPQSSVTDMRQDFMLLSDLGGIPYDMTVENLESTCPVSCASFATCAIEQCPGYDAPDNDFGANAVMEVLVNEHLLKDSAGI